MGRRSRKTRSQTNSKTKFVIIGIVCAAVVAGIAAVAINPDITKADSPNTKRLSLDTRSGSPTLGDPEAPITIIEFGDYQCPFCKQWNTSTKPQLEKDLIESREAKLVYIDFPIIGQDSMTAHMGSYCAEEQGLYWQYHDYVYSKQGHENDGWASSDNIKSLASEIDGMDVSMFSECLDSEKYKKRVEDNKKIAIQSGVTSTPTFIVIGPGSAEMIKGAQPYGVFKEVTDNLAR